MNTLDLLIISITLALAALGYAQGFIVGAASIGGLALGALVGTRVTHALLDRSGGEAGAAGAANWAPIIGLGVGLLITLIGAMAMQDLGASLRGQVRDRVAEMTIADHVMGAILLGAVGLLIAWVSAAAAVGIPQLRELRPQIVTSRIVSELNGVLPDAGPLLGVIASYDPFPTFDGGKIVAAAPDAALPRDPEVRNASRSVVRVVGTACGYRITGTGWVGATGYVITNAHVVAGQRDTAVQVAGRGELIDADVVSFDEVNDIAVLRVGGLDLTPLRPIAKVDQGAAAAVLGYPENRGFVATPARFSDERTVRGDDIYGLGSHQRRVTSFRGIVRHGNSGGPVVDGDGRVISTVFASTVGSQVRGGYGVPNDLAGDALAFGRAVPDGKVVRTGRCVG
ncbi:MAG: Colicin production protein [Thermoleophilia bacterium]|nr:Colicin production protein [Thermoleophilia bacterium]